MAWAGPIAVAGPVAACPGVNPGATPPGPCAGVCTEAAGTPTGSTGGPPAKGPPTPSTSPSLASRSSVNSSLTRRRAYSRKGTVASGLTSRSPTRLQVWHTAQVHDTRGWSLLIRALKPKLMKNYAQPTFVFIYGAVSPYDMYI